MRIALKVGATGIAAALVFTSAVGCSQSSRVASEASATAAALDARHQRADAVLAYVEAQRTLIPKIQEVIPGLYSNIRVEATLEDQRGDRGIPAGTYAVAWFYYTYASDMDWSSTMDVLDAQRSNIDELCEAQIFPEMRAAGVTGNMSVVYSYDDGRSEFGPLWSHTCSIWD